MENNCLECDGVGWINYQENGHSFAKRCKCLEKQIIKFKFNNLLKSADVYNDAGMTFENYKPRNKSQNNVLNRLQSRYGSFYLYGPWGVGKTHLTTASVIQAVDNGTMAVRISVPQLLKQIRKFKDDDLEIEKKAAEIPYLVLDDIGKQKDSLWTEERLFMLINHRYGGYKAGLLHTSFTSQSPVLKLKLDGAIIDRIAGMCEEIFIDGKSYRQLMATK